MTHVDQHKQTMNERMRGGFEYISSVLLRARFFARREEKQILRSAQDDMSFRVQRSGARPRPDGVSGNLLLVAALGRAVPR